MNPNFKDFQKANFKTKTLIKALCDYVPPDCVHGHISITIDKCKANNRTVFEFNDYLLINIDGMVFYCLKTDIEGGGGIE